MRPVKCVRTLLSGAQNQKRKYRHFNEQRRCNDINFNLSLLLFFDFQNKNFFVICNGEIAAKKN